MIRRAAPSVRGALLAAVLAATAAVPVLRAEVRLPHIFGSHMVLQRDRPVPVWGWAAPGETVTVKVDQGAAVSAKADDAGAWKATLPAMPAGGPHVVTVAGSSTVVFEDVLVGEVWLCSGQSNMEFTLGGVTNAAAEIAAADFPQIRHIGFPKVTAGAPQTDVPGEWRVCTPATAGGFTAVGYCFARELQRKLNVPVGLVHSSWGGTRIEPWTTPAAFALVPSLDGIRRRVELADPRSDAHKARLRDHMASVEKWLGQAREAVAAGTLIDPPPAWDAELSPLRQSGDPCALYYAMIHPLAPFALRGAIWYQGESNHNEGKLYTDKMRALIEGWRTVWGQGDFPFYFVQIAPFVYGEEDPFILPSFWEAQQAALAITNTGMAVIHDVGNIRDIHPRNKQEVGRRLALQALAKTYGLKDTVCEGPVFASLAIEGSKLRVKFDHADGGLVTRDGAAPTCFEIVGKDMDFVPADAVIDGASVVLSSAACPAPTAVRFGWHKIAEPNLANGAGLPAGPFRAGDVPRTDWLTAKVPEAKDYRLVYDLDLAKLGAKIKYDEDHAAELAGPFDRIAYFLELQKAGEQVKYVYVSMDAFTKDVRKIGVPALDTQASFQQPVQNMNVVCNVPGIAGGTGLAGGNIEFWPHNYAQPNDAKVPNASDSLWDFGDQRVEPRDGYGCMQVHNHDAKQTLFAINHWVAGGAADIGIGNNQGETRDWTFAGNGGSYTVKRLRVLVRPAR